MMLCRLFAIFSANLAASLSNLYELITFYILLGGHTSSCTITKHANNVTLDAQWKLPIVNDTVKSASCNRVSLFSVYDSVKSEAASERFLKLGKCLRTRR